MGRSDVENGTHRTRPSPGPIRTDMSRTWISILNSTLGTLPTIGPFSTHPRTLTFRLILTPSVFLSRLNQEVANMQNAGSLTGRKKAAALAKGLKAQETLNKYSQCNVFWQP